jgi:hypothetical protein
MHPFRPASPSPIACCASLIIPSRRLASSPSSPPSSSPSSIPIHAAWQRNAALRQVLLFSASDCVNSVARCPHSPANARRCCDHLYLLDNHNDGKDTTSTVPVLLCLWLAFSLSSVAAGVGSSPVKALAAIRLGTQVRCGCPFQHHRHALGQTTDVPSRRRLGYAHMYMLSSCTSSLILEPRRPAASVCTLSALCCTASGRVMCLIRVLLCTSHRTSHLTSIASQRARSLSSQPLSLIVALPTGLCQHKRPFCGCRFEHDRELALHRLHQIGPRPYLGQPYSITVFTTRQRAPLS